LYPSVRDDVGEGQAFHFPTKAGARKSVP
jgi:hypothetical protein